MSAAHEERRRKLNFYWNRWKFVFVITIARCLFHLASADVRFRCFFFPLINRWHLSNQQLKRQEVTTIPRFISFDNCPMSRLSWRGFGDKELNLPPHDWNFELKNPWSSKRDFVSRYSVRRPQRLQFYWRLIRRARAVVEHKLLIAPQTQQLTKPL